ncbi:MAG: PEP-CTERM sorting domain-containing protein [Gemmataceae bacterium]
MKRWVVVLAVIFLAVARSVNAEVVLGSYPDILANRGQGIALSTTTPAKINWTVAGFSGYLNRVKFLVYNNGSNSLNALRLSFGLDSSASTMTLDYAARGGDIAAQAYSEWEYDLGSLLTVSAGASGSLFFKLVSQSSGASAQWATTTNPVNEYYGWSGASTENPSSGQFELSAVPEPGTWVLMALAQALGGLWWWKRRKSRPVPGL